MMLKRYENYHGLKFPVRPIVLSNLAVSRRVATMTGIPTKFLVRAERSLTQNLDVFHANNILYGLAMPPVWQILCNMLIPENKQIRTLVGKTHKSKVSFNAGSPFGKLKFRARVKYSSTSSFFVSQ